MAVKKGQEVARQRTNNSLLVKFGEKFSLDPQKFLEVVSKTVFKEAKSQEQVIALLMVADQYGLNPVTKEIYAFPDKGGGVVPVVGVDGWNRIAQQHPQFNGVEFRYADAEIVPDGGKRSPAWVECIVYRKDRDHPVVVREYLDECYRKTGPWQSHTKRMLRHKALIQGYRTAFGFHGIYDEDEAERMYVEGVPSKTVEVPSSNAEKARMALGKATTPKEPPKAAERPVEDEVEFSAARIKGGVVTDITDEFEDVADARGNPIEGEAHPFSYVDGVPLDDDTGEVRQDIIDEDATLTGEVVEERPPNRLSDETYAADDDFQRVTDLAKQALDAVEEAEEVEEVEEKVIPPATKKQLDALVAAKKRGGWSNELVSRLIKEQYGVAKAAELNREQALELMKHLLAGSEEATQDDFGI